MDLQSDAEFRALDARCRLPTSPASRTAVIKLRALPPDRQAYCIVNYAECDLPHLVRCSLLAVRSGPHKLCVRLTPSHRASQPTRAGGGTTRPSCASPPRRAVSEC